jgi:S-adenosylmethionine hydrolase
MSAIVTLTTDYGNDDHYVGTMKGVVLQINPRATLVDICHAVPAYDVLQGAITLAQAYRYFPAGTVHVVVVDPGVGTARRPIVADAGQHRFVAPDNGVLSFVYERESSVAVREITNDELFLHPVSSTFHGRDIFAPVAAHLSRGIDAESVGPVISDHVRLDIPKPLRLGQSLLQGSVLKIDRFGNIVTNLTPEDITPDARNVFRVRIASTEIPKLRHTYSGANHGELFAIFGSMGFLEIAVNQGSAAELLRVRVGDPVEVHH